MRTFVYGELRSMLESGYVAYCYRGSENRGSIAFKDNDGSIIIAKPNGYIMQGDYFVDDISNFELWSFIHEIKDEADFDIREEAVTRLYDVYCVFYNSIPMLQEFPFLME